MTTTMMPEFQRLSDGTPVALWHDESDARWVIATFLRSDIGFSSVVADEVIRGLSSVIAGRLESWTWDGNAFRLQATRQSACLELCDPDVPACVRPVSLPTPDVREILQRWKGHFLGA
jgi:hypothetical protein